MQQLKDIICSCGPLQRRLVLYRAPPSPYLTTSINIYIQMMRAPAMLRCSLSDVDCFLINQTELWSQTFILFSSRKVVLEASLERVSSAVFILTKRIKLDHLQLDICEEEEEEEGRGESVGAGSCQSMTGVSAVLSPGNSSDSHQTPLTCPSSGYFYIFSLAERNAFNECFLHFSFYKECKLLLS